MRALRTEGKSGEYRKLRTGTWLYASAVAIVIAALVFIVLFQAVQVSDDGMAPVLQRGDIVLFDRLAKHLSMPDRGDAYAFLLDGKVCVGRIVGLPGDKVQIADGIVYIGGVMLDERRYATLVSGISMDPVTLENGQFFLMPDNREWAVIDPKNMTIPFEDLIGRADLRVSPLSRVSLFVR